MRFLVQYERALVPVLEAPSATGLNPEQYAQAVAYVQAEQGMTPTLWYMRYDERVEYRLCDSASNAWYGVIEDHTGDPRADLTALARVDFDTTHAYAQHLVRMHNLNLLRAIEDAPQPNAGACDGTGSCMHSPCPHDTPNTEELD